MPDYNSDWMDLPALDGKEDRLETALHRLLRNLTAGGMYRGNPYCNQDIKEAFEALHAEKASRKTAVRVPSRIRGRKIHA